MATLDDAAEAALAKVRELGHHADEAEVALSGLEGHLSDAATKLESDWQSLAEELRSLLDQVQADKARLTEHGEKTEHALSDAHQAALSAEQEALQELDAARGDLTTLDGQVQAATSEVAQLADQVEAAARALKEDAAEVQSQVAEGLSQLHDLLSVQLVDDLRSLQHAVEERSHALEQAVSDTYTAALHAKFDNWLSTLHDVEALVSKAFHDAHDHVSQVVEYCLYECATRHREAIAELTALLPDLEAAADRLSETITHKARELEQGRNALVEGMQETDARLQAMTAALNGIRELMSSYSFVRV